ncbi:MAG: Asp-tRNA(Asn)/Glu-tRNA(Gln) amidotransferase subunit GatC [Candidatus Paceibacterota bacterium]|jgi:aspartyl-tRNA(Asn)/glutamyl-tRNA(Gln) amidotransferase subunit C
MQIEEIKKLANLARIDMTENEMEGIAKDFGAILAYVGQVQQVSAEKEHMEKKPDDYFLHNVVREDVVTSSRGSNTEKIIGEMPDTQDGFLKVKQIL